MFQYAEGPEASNSEEHGKLVTIEETELVNRMSEELSLDDSAVDIKIEDRLTSTSTCGNSQAASAEVNLQSSEEPTRKLSTFAAEEELDMLLDSVSEIEIMDSSSFPSNTSFPVPLGATSVNASLISNKEPDSSKTPLNTASIDDVLDDLLEETSNVLNPNALSRPQEVKPVIHSTQSSSSQHGTKSKVLDEFDSWLDTQFE